MPRRNNARPHQPFRQPADCTSKRRFTTRALAQRAADDQMLMQMDLELEVYQCNLCGKWHLTSSKK